MSKKKKSSPKKNPPKIEIKVIDDKQCLLVNGKVSLIADSVFEHALFRNSRMLAVVFENDGKIQVRFSYLKKSDSTTALLEPRPESGYVLRLLGKPEDRQMRVLYRARDGMFYMLFSESLKIAGPLTKGAGQAIIEEHGAI